MQHKLKLLTSYYLFLFILGNLTLSGCAVLAVGAVGAAAGTTAVVASDPRSSGTVINDNAVENKLRMTFTSTNYPNSNIYVNCYNGTVLLTGQVATAAQKRQAEFNAKTIPNVKQIYNYLQIRLPQSFLSSSTDSYTTTQIKTKILGLQDVHSNDVKVVTTNGIVYLFGIVTRKEAQEVANAAASINGVNKVITFFEYVSS